MFVINTPFTGRRIAAAKEASYRREDMKLLANYNPIILRIKFRSNMVTAQSSKDGTVRTKLRVSRSEMRYHRRIDTRFNNSRSTNRNRGSSDK